MSGHEPPSGWNLPPGCFEGDRDAPWNAPEPRTCGMCEHLLEGCCDYGTCDLEFREAFEAEHLRTLWDAAEWARDWVADNYRDMQGEACGRFEG